MIVQKLVRSKFTAHTIIAVAHKLDTILDFDKVVVMHHGSLIEYGAPHKLLETEGSRFRSLYEEISKKDGSSQAGDDDIIRIIE